MSKICRRVILWPGSLVWALVEQSQEWHQVQQQPISSDSAIFWLRFVDRRKWHSTCALRSIHTDIIIHSRPFRCTASAAINSPFHPIQPSSSPSVHTSNSPISKKRGNPSSSAAGHPANAIINKISWTKISQMEKESPIGRGRVPTPSQRRFYAKNVQV